jgi:DNA primase
MHPADALALVRDAERRLWTPEGEKALAYLHRRGLSDSTIRAARLGWTPPLDLRGRPRGITIPWFDGDRLALLKIRQPDRREPKYYELFQDRPTLYPGRHVIRTGRPLIIPEGELDALLKGQELADLDVSVVTLGSASSRPTPDILCPMLAAPVWYVATDADGAGDDAARAWPDRARRVRPPMLRPHPDDQIAKPKTDWTDLHQHGVNLRRWWSDRLQGIEAPPLFTWEELSTWRWGQPAAEPDALAEREAIQTAEREENAWIEKAS